MFNERSVLTGRDYEFWARRLDGTDIPQWFKNYYKTRLLEPASVINGLFHDGQTLWFSVLANPTPMYRVAWPLVAI